LAYPPGGRILQAASSGSPGGVHDRSDKRERIAIQQAYRRYCQAAAVAFVLVTLYTVPTKLLTGPPGGRLGAQRAACGLGRADRLRGLAGPQPRTRAGPYLGARRRLLRAWRLWLVHLRAAAGHPVGDPPRRRREPVSSVVERPGAGHRPAPAAFGKVARSRTPIGQGAKSGSPGVLPESGESFWSAVPVTCRTSKLLLRSRRESLGGAGTDRSLGRP
jgi:hypothetical protein